MDGSLIPNLIELAIGILIYKPLKEFATSMIEWLSTANLNEETIVDFLKYHFPKLAELLDKD